MKKNYENVEVTSESIKKASTLDMRLAEAVTSPGSFHYEGRDLAKVVFDVRLDLISFASAHNHDDFLVHVLKVTKSSVASPIAFVKLLEPDQHALPLQQLVVSPTNCHEGEAEWLPGHLEQVGAWVACIRQKRPIVYSDKISLFQSQPTGILKGKALLLRTLLVPVIRGEKVVAILGACNKDVDYDQKDIDILGYLADVVWEIVQSKQAESQLICQKEIECACAELSAKLLTNRDLKEITSMILDVAKRLTQSRIGFVGSIDKKTGHLVMHSYSGVLHGRQKTPESSPVFTTFTGPWGWVLDNRQPLMTNGIGTNAYARDFPAGHVAIEAFLGVPALSGNEALGLIALANPEKPYAENDQNIAERLATLLALALQRYTLEVTMIEAEARKTDELETLVGRRTKELQQTNSQLQGEVDRRKQIESALIAEKKTVRLYLDIARVGFAAVDINDRITMANDYLCRTLEFSERELLGRLWTDLLFVTDSNTIAADEVTSLSQQIDGQFACHIALMHTKSGEVRIFAWNDVKLRNDDGELQGMVRSGEDITERIRAEEQLQKSRFHQELIAGILHNTPLAMLFFVVDHDQIRILDWNVSAKTTFGWSKDEVLGKDFFDFLPNKEDMVSTQEIFGQLKTHPGPHNHINLCNHKSGETILIHWFNNSFVEEKTGRIYVVSLGHDITAQHAYEQRLRHSEVQARTIADFTFDWEEWRAPDGNYLYVSPSCLRITGYPRETFLQDSELTLTITHPDDLATMTRHLQHEQADKEAHQIDYRIITKAGDIRWISHCCQPVFSDQGEWLGRRGSNRDISDRKVAEQQLLESRNMLQLVVDGIREPLLLMQTDGWVLMMNRAACQYFRVDPDETRTSTYNDLIHDLNVCADNQLEEILKTRQNTQYERKGQLDTRKTERVYIDMLSAATRWPDMAIMRIQDITVEKQVERDLLQADKMISLGTLVSGVAHEINNPNNFISLNTNLLKDSWESLKPVLERYYLENDDFLVAGLPYSEMKEEIPNLLIGIDAGSRRIQRIVGELKEYSVPNLERMEEILHINSIAQQAIALIGNRVAQFTDNFFVDYANNLPPVKGDSQKLEQALINLVLNACQSLPDRTKSIRLRTTSDQEKDTLSIIVQDQGRGIPENILPQIMNPFFTTKRDIGGTGLGLSVSSRIISEHKGRLEVQSQIGQGSIFTIHLPTINDSTKFNN